MIYRYLFSFSLTITVLLLNSIGSFSQTNDDERHIQVAMRMIGHQVLLTFGDSTSRVLPIEQEENTYKIKFESNFGFNPDDLVATIDQVVKNSQVAGRYLVEVEDCETKEVVYSYEMKILPSLDMVPCKARTQPVACYSLFFTFLNPIVEEVSLVSSKEEELDDLAIDKKESYSFKNVLLLFMPILFLGIFFYLRKKRDVKDINPNLVKIGEFQYDKVKKLLEINGQKSELTSKEGDLLNILYSSANITLERETLLKMIWGDEGDYIGRTLDVYISKLRKKLEADADVKIVNTRGVGYMLVMN